VLGHDPNGLYPHKADGIVDMRISQTSQHFQNGRALFLVCFLIMSAIFLMSEPLSIFGQKAVVLTFDDGWKNQMSNAVPIMEKYDFRATFFIVCNYVDKEGRMTWEDISGLDKLGYDIQSHTMNHKDLTKLSSEDLEYEVGNSKQCLLEHGFPNSTIFATPFNAGWNNATVVNVTAKYYDMGRSGNGEPMFLDCSKYTKDQKDCRTYYDNGTLTFANRYTIKGWSHNFYDKKYAHDTNRILEEFIRVVERQTRYNTNQTFEALPVIIYHKVDAASNDSGTTTTELFEKEMQYLHDNGFEVITMSDLHYDTKASRFYAPALGIDDLKAR
jgi:peptidoglycan/xylan/chitin deacetylase (PgdA/CDA1 family)